MQNIKFAISYYPYWKLRRLERRILDNIRVLPNFDARISNEVARVTEFLLIPRLDPDDFIRARP